MSFQKYTAHVHVYELEILDSEYATCEDYQFADEIPDFTFEFQGKPSTNDVEEVFREIHDEYDDNEIYDVIVEDIALV